MQDSLILLDDLVADATALGLRAVDVTAALLRTSARRRRPSTGPRSRVLGGEPLSVPTHVAAILRETPRLAGRRTMIGVAVRCSSSSCPRARRGPDLRLTPVRSRVRAAGSSPRRGGAPHL
ncbi:hypothetical protein [Nannocystis pusilla]|uniref:hypothetical protein n=1 Tax=Nannocystis pusilla TaxID=889268 RepID=UPI003B78CEAE